MKKNDQHIPIRISGIADGQHDFDVVVTAADIGLPAEFPAEVAVHVHMDKTHSQIILTVDAASTAVYPCDRCLDPVTIPVAQRFVLMYARDVTAARVLDDDEVRVINPVDAFIDIGDDVRDFALLGIPMRRTCGEDADGAPLCRKPIQTPATQTDAQTDPRWDKLRVFQAGTQ